jgi:hypothetical protein
VGGSAARAAAPLDGFGPAKFGMSVDAVRGLYPGIAPAPPIAGDSFLSHPNMARLYLEKATVMGLKHPVAVEFRFWKNELWTVIVYFLDNSFEDVTAMLTRQYGPADTPGDDPAWVRDNAKLVTMPGGHWYSMNDTRISAAAKADLIQSLHDEAARRKASRTPVATPGH